MLLLSLLLWAAFMANTPCEHCGGTTWQHNTQGTICKNCIPVTCQICHTTFRCDTYGDATCPTCHVLYRYEEGQQIDFTPEQAEKVKAALSSP